MKSSYSLCLCLMVLPWLAGCGGEGDCVSGGQGHIVGTISPQQLWADLGSATRPTIIDVRDPAAYALAHLPGSANDCGCSALAAASAEPSLNIVVVGETLQQAIIAGPRVLQAGETARVLEGGLQSWPYGLDLSGAQLTRWLQGARDLDLIDVRTPAEWQAGHLPNSVNYPLAELPVWAETLDPSREIVLICSSGLRSANARDQLLQRGFTKVHNLLGGLVALG